MRPDHALLPRRAPRAPTRRRQHGVASLIIVALLFFILSLAAAYVNRNLIFEQRTSANQYRATLALEAADAGVEWALALLNAGRVTDTCEPTADVALQSFRNRYLQLDATTGLVGPSGVLTAAGEGTTWAGCVYTGAAWDCSCPNAGAATLAAPVGAGVFPAFQLRFAQFNPPRPGLVRLDVNACTRLDASCLDFPSQAVGGEGRVTVSTVIALRGGLAAPPAAALTVRGTLDAGGAALNVLNADIAAGGIALRTGDVVANGASLVVAGPPGTPSEAARMTPDGALTALALPTPERLFGNTFAMPSAMYRDQPATFVLDCPAACNAAGVQAVVDRHPGRMIWVNGDLDIDAPLGTALDPVLIVSNGEVDVQSTFTGLVYGRPNAWVTDGTAAGLVQGAVVAEDGMNNVGSFSIVYDADVLTRLRWGTGSFVRVPGGWRDF